ncbi:MAG: condensation domain-containing protein, partial [Pyrinomonadaceae bacterium]
MKNIEAIYPLMPAQQGMLFETLSDTSSGVFIEQFVCPIRGDLDIGTFERAWHEIIHQHAALRTCFVWKNRQEPLQVVLPSVKVPFEKDDLRHLAPTERQATLDAFLKSERERHFDLSRAPLMRLALLRMEDQLYQLVWTYHHILMDGWCWSVLLKQVLTHYQSLLDGRELERLPGRSLKDHQVWLKEQDWSRAEAFWRGKLSGFTRPTALGIAVSNGHSIEGEPGFDDFEVSLHAPATTALRSFARQQHLALNVVIQGMWALLLSRYSGDEDVVFGATFSGRPPELAGIEAMIGLVFNTLPVRVRVSPQAMLLSWLKELQNEQIGLQAYQCSSSGQVHQWSGISSSLPLFESIVVFQNALSNISLPPQSGFTIDWQSISYTAARTKYPLTILIYPHAELQIRFVFDRRRLAEQEVTKIADHFLLLLQEVVTSSERDVARFLEAIPVSQIPRVHVAPKADASPSAKVAQRPRGSTEEALAEIWREILGLEQVGRNDNFFRFGGHSLLATQLITRLRQTFHISLPLGALFSSPTVADLALRIEEAVQQLTTDEDPGDQLPTIIAAPGDRYQPFPLTDIQQAYWIGRGNSFALSNVACHVYVEFESANLDPQRLEAAWQRLIERHEMLRAIVLPDGQQRILPEVPPYRIEVEDLRDEDQPSTAERLAATRDCMSHQMRSPDQWPLFEIRISLLSRSRIRLHISLDVLIVDGWSILLLFREWSQLYLNPDTQLPRLEISFRDYVLAETAFHDSATYQRAWEYWQTRLSTLAPAPELPFAQSPEAITQPRFIRRTAQLPAQAWARLKQRAAAAGLTPSTILCAAYAEVLARWSKSRRFTLNLTLFNRLPLHAQVNHLVGDFTSLTLLQIDHRAGSSFEERARDLQQQLWRDLDHRYVSGVSVLRELVRQRRDRHGAMMPVVFTSAIGHWDGEQNTSPIAWLGEMVYSVTQTPQVWLDNQVYEDAGTLVLNWDAVEELFPDGLLDSMFSAYCQFLQRLADDDSLWHSS